MSEKINYHGFGAEGIHPIGVQKLIESSATTNKLSYYVRGKFAFMYGVVMLRARLGPGVVDRVIRTLYNSYPINFGIKRFGVITIQTRVGGISSIRGVHVIGDVCDLAKFWAHLQQGRIHFQGIQITQDAVCWSGYGCIDKNIVPYLDFDELATSKSSFHSIYEERIGPAVEMVHSVLQQAHPSLALQYYFNCRKSPSKVGLWKFSFHVHFYNAVVNSKDFKHLLLSPNSPRRLVWVRGDDGEYTTKIDDNAPIFDTSVYGGEKQLFRGPYCGKSDDSSSQLMPIVIRKNHTDQWEPYIDEGNDKDPDVIQQEFIFRARITSPVVPEAGFKLIDLSSFLVTPDELGTTARSDPIEHVDCSFLDGGAMYSFMKPIIHLQIVPEWQKFRKLQRDKLDNCSGIVPTSFESGFVSDTLSTFSNTVRFLSVHGDTYCMTDDSHYHSQQTKSPIRIGLDMQCCTIWQYCFACATKGQVYKWLHTGNRIRICTLEESAMQAEEMFTLSKQPHSFILDYYRDMFVFNKQRDSVYVYNEPLGVWVTGGNANPVIGDLIDKLNVSYESYAHQRQVNVATSLIAKYKRQTPDASDDEIAKKTDSIHAAGRKFLVNHAIIICFPSTTRLKLVDELKSYRVHLTIETMNPFPHLIPLSDGQCVDVFNGLLTPVQKHHYFTSLLSATYTDNEEELSLISTWFEQVSTGDTEKEHYLKVICGYCMTHLMHDRKFYVFRGSGKNGKSLLKELLLRACDGAHSTEARYKNMNQQFWEKRANANQGSEAPSPEAYQVIDKCILSTDDIEQTSIDSGKLKRMVAGEQISGRPLFGQPKTIVPRAKVVWTTNHTPLLNGHDNALWERLSLVDFLAKWVENAELVDNSEYRFLQDNMKYQRMLTLTNAFFTVCVSALTDYYGSLPRGPDGKPISLTPFPVPAVMKKDKASSRAQQLPLADFLDKHTQEEKNPLNLTTLDDLFEMYLTFLDNSNEVSLRRQTTKALFERQLNSSLEVKTVSSNGRKFVYLKIVEAVHKKQRTDTYVTADSAIR